MLQPCLQIIDPLAKRIRIGWWQVLGFAQVLLKAKDCLKFSMAV